MLCRGVSLLCCWEEEGTGAGSIRFPRPVQSYSSVVPCKKQIRLAPHFLFCCPIFFSPAGAETKLSSPSSCSLAAYL